VHTVSRRGLLAASGVALAAGPLLAACGDDASGGSSGRVRLGYFGNITHAPALVGLQSGLFAQALPASAELTTTVFNAGPSAIEALFSDAIDISYIGPNPAVNGWAQSGGQALHIIAGSTSGGAGLVVDDGITTVADLEGKRIATPQLGNTQDVAARYWLAQQGLDTDPSGGGDVAVIPTDNAEVAAAFDGGAVDAAWAVEPRFSELVIEHGANVFLDERELWDGGEFVTTHVIVRKQFLDDNPDLVTAFLKGHLAALDSIAERPDEAQTLANDHLASLSGNRLDDAIVAAAFANLTFTADPIADSLAGSAEHAVEVGLLEPVDLTGIYRLELLNELLAERGEPEVSAGGLA
jgi:NitT/TauT family transport system substrate-binding protein